MNLKCEFLLIIMIRGVILFATEKFIHAFHKYGISFREMIIGVLGIPIKKSNIV